MVTGGADSKLVVWRDVTQDELEAEHKAQQESQLQEQILLNHMKKRQYDSTLRLPSNIIHTVPL